MYDINIKEMSEQCYNRNASAINALPCKQTLRIFDDSFRLYNILLSVEMITTVHNARSGAEEIVLIAHDSKGTPRFINIEKGEYMDISIL